MSGRGQRGRGRGRFNSRGRGRGNSSGGGSKGKPSVPTKKTLADHVYTVGSAKQASEYQTNTKFILNHIAITFKEGHDIATALKERTEMNFSTLMPQMKQSESTDKTVKAIEQEQFKILYQAEIKAYVERQECYRANKSTAYALIWKQCNKALQAKLQTRTDFNSTVEGNPIELLKAIEEHSVSYQDKRYPYSTVYDAMKNLLNIRQKDDESLIDYTARFKSVRDVAMSQLGAPVEIKPLVDALHSENTRTSRAAATMSGSSSTTPNRSDAVSRIYKDFITFVYLDSADKLKYGTLLNQLQQQYSLGNDQYPKELVDATNVLSNHRFDPAYKENKEKQKKKDGSRSRNPQQQQQDDPAPTSELSMAQIRGMTFAQMQGRCYVCGSTGHRVPQCSERNTRPRQEWAINQTKDIRAAQAVCATAQPPSTIDSAGTAAGSAAGSVAGTESSIPSWMICQVVQEHCHTMSSAEEIKRMELLDSQSTCHHYTHGDYVTDVKPSSSTLQMATNGGVAYATKTAVVNTFPGFPDRVWYGPGITNVLSLALVCKHFRVTFDSAKELAFLVHTDTGIIRYAQTKEGLFARVPGVSTPTKTISLVQTVAENLAKFSKADQNAALAARKLLHSMGYPSISDLKALIARKCIQNNPVTIADVERAEEIWGPDVGMLKGKLRRKRPLLPHNDTAGVPAVILNKNRDIDLCVDVMYVNGIPFLTSVSKKLMFRSADPLPNRSNEAILEFIKKIFHLYLNHGAHIRRLSADGEFKSVAEGLQKVFGIEPNIAAPNDHVGEIENTNKVLQERTRAAFHSLPFTAMPRLMIKTLVMESARKANFVPPRGGLSPFHSPREILLRRTIDYNKECLYPMFSYVLGFQDRQQKNTQHERGIDCIYLRPVKNGHELMSLQSGQLINRPFVTLIPMTKDVIDVVNALGAAQGMNGLKIQTKTGHVLWNSAWIAGVDYTADQTNSGTDPFEAVYNYDDDEDEEQEEEDEDNEAASEDDEEVDDVDPNDIDPDEADGEPIQADSDEEEDDEPPELVQSEEDSDSDDDSDDEDEQEEQEQEHSEAPVATTRSGRAISKPSNFVPMMTGQTHGLTNVQREYALAAIKEIKHNQGKAWKKATTEELEAVDSFEYTTMEAKVLAMIMCQFNERMEAHSILDDSKEARFAKQFVVTYSLKKGLQKFGQKGRLSVLKEMKQLLDRKCFHPIDVKSMSPQERKRALESLIFLTEKRDGTIKSRHCANGNPQRQWMDREEVSSPTVSTEATMLTAVIEAEEGRDVATLDIPNAFIQTSLEKVDKEGNRTVMKIRGALVGILCELDPSYRDYIVEERGQQVVYTHITKALYGLLVSAMLFYKRLRSDLEEYGFVVNPYDPCVANKMVEGKQLTVSWHVDDLKASHMNSKVIDQFIQWVKDTYGSIGEVKTTRGKVHDYLGMKLDYSVPGQVKIDMVDYVDTMIEAFPQECLRGSAVASPWNDNLFKVQEKSPLLSKQGSEQFHTTTAQGLFLCKRARPDIAPAIAYLTTRVRAPNQDDLGKLIRLMKWLKQTRKDCLTLKSDGERVGKWHVDASFAVHPDYRSHTGAGFSLGKGNISSISRKQGMNTRSSTEAEVVAADEVVGPMLWTRLFLEAQGYPLKDNILYQDNQSAMLLETNGRKSAGKRSRHLNIRYFFVADQQAKGHISIKYCPTDEMLGDYFTKPTHGTKFKGFREEIMNLPTAAQLMMLGCMNAIPAAVA